MKIVVGFIDTPEGHAAVDAALSEAKLRGGSLVVVNSMRGGTHEDERTYQATTDAFEELTASLTGSSLPNPEDIDNLGDLLDEFIDHLPYQSPLMALSEDTWLSLGPDQREQIYVDVSSKLSFYQLIYEDVDRWIALHANADDGDKVYPMPLSLLP